MKRYVIDLQDLRQESIDRIFSALYCKGYSFNVFNYDNIIIVETAEDLRTELLTALPIRVALDVKMVVVK